MMKYVAMHQSNFKYPYRAYLMGFLDMCMIFGVEIINLWNLSNITEGGVQTLMFDFIALGIIAEFDDYFFELYKHVEIRKLIDIELLFENVKTPKRKQRTLRQDKFDKSLGKTKVLLKEF
jgi:hypothetical protein